MNSKNVGTEQPPQDAAAFWEFADRQDVRDLTARFINGLIHELEYAHAIVTLAADAGIQLPEAR